MQSSVGIRERIDHVYPSLRPAERAVAQYIRNHIEEAADLTVGQMADIAHVSQPTVIRFARKLGFGGNTRQPFDEIFSRDSRVVCRAAAD